MNKPSLSTWRLFAMAMAVTAPLCALAQPQEVAHSSTVSTTAHEMAREESTLTATVVSVDPQAHSVTLRGPNGKEITVEAGPEVHNFNQLKPGDVVTTHYLRAVALQLLPADSAEPGVEYERGPSSADKGDKPGMEASHAVTVTTELTDVDVEHHTVTLTGADGHQRTVEVRDPERRAMLAKLKVGEMVRITYMEAMAVTVVPKVAPKPKD
jgi:hypothetical protein